MKNQFSSFLNQEIHIYNNLNSKIRIHWIYIRFFYFNDLFNRKFTENKSIQFLTSFRYWNQILKSLKGLSRRKETFLVASSKEAQEVVHYFQKSHDILPEKSLHLSILTYNQTSPGLVYVDVIKILARLISSILSKFQKNTKDSIIYGWFWESRIMVFCFRWLFRIIRPTQLYVINWYTFYPAVVAAKQLNIQVHEIQHGVIHKEHPGYNVNPQIPIRYYPDQFHLWDKKFCSQIQFQGDKNFQIIGFPLAKTEDIPGSSSKSLLIISQASISDEIQAHLQKIKPFLESYTEVIFRIHPKEMGGKHIQLPENCVISYPEDELFDEVLARVSDVLGVFSTGLLKAEQLQKKVFLMDLPEKRKIEELLTGDYKII